MGVKCRGCGHILPEQFLLQYPNMPKSAQFFPDGKEVKTEQGVDIILKQCLFCGLIQAVGNPVSYYRDVIRATGVSDEMGKFREGQYRKWVTKFHLTGKKIIEIGCGKGEYMSYMEKTGAMVYGLEHLQDSVNKGRAEGHEIFQGFLENEEYQIPLAPYDGFYIMNFLEHIPNPGDFLRGIINNLGDGAVGIVEVPNFDMMLKKSLYSEFIQDHLSYFTEDTVRNLLERNGFQVLNCESIWHDYILSVTVKKRLFAQVEGFIRKQEDLKEEIRMFLDQQKKNGKRVAAWGAGHQALANLSLLDMAEDIEYVIDSADFKQNRYTPATHIPIVAPDRLLSGEVQVVIIMAAGFSQEIKQIMNEKFPKVDKVILTEEGLI